MLTEPKNKQEKDIYKANSNLVSFCLQQDKIKQLRTVERKNTVIPYGKKTFAEKVLSWFAGDYKNTERPDMWVEVSE